MIITYKPNPLASTVELEPIELLVLRHRIAEDLAKQKIILLKVAFEQKDYKRVEKELSDPFSYYGRPLDERVEEDVEYSVAALMDSHCGDCTCVAASCSKCRAECFIGIDTIDGISQHAAHYVMTAFSVIENAVFVRHHDDVDLALKTLAEPTVATEDWHKDHVDRWRAEKEEAFEWLQNYSKTLMNTTVTVQIQPQL